MNPHRLTWGFAYNFPFALLVSIVLFIGFFLSREPKKIPWTRESIVLFLFVLWMFISTVFSQYPWLAWAQWDKVWKIQLMTFMSLMLMGSEKRINGLMWVIVFSIGFFAIKGGVFTIITGGVHQVLGPPGTFIGERNTLAIAINMTLPLMRYLQLRANSRWIRYGLTVAMILSAFGSVGTLSRGGLLGLLAMGSVLLIKTRRSILIAIFFAFTGLVIFSFMPESWEERMNTMLDPEVSQTDASAHNRVRSWEFGYHKALERPITGGGFEIYIAENGTDAHSIWLEILGEQGFVGLTLYLLIWLMAWRSASWIIKNAKKHKETEWMRDLAAMLQASMAGYAVGGSFLGLAYFDLFYQLLAVLILCKVLLKQYLAEEIAQVSDDINSFGGMVSRSPSN
jgi:probable O-glycosylation ligase (exosortase A-associated)